MEKRILVVENDPYIRDAMVRAFSRDGYETAIAESDDGALLQLFLTRPDLIILNLPLPASQGHHTLQQIRKFSSVPLIGLVSTDDPETIVTSLENGADQILTRPFNVHELCARVRALLRRAG
jgi:DNA-binding response OmpR family regulator